MMRQIKMKVVSTVLTILLAAAFTTTAFADGETPPPAPETPQVGEEQVAVTTDQNPDVPLAAPVTSAAPVVEKDPIWCPAGVAPKPNVGGCSPSYANLSSLVTGGIPGGSGTIWIEQGADNGTQVEINGTGNWASAVNYNLTLQGGWDGVAGSTKVVGVSVFDTAISIVNWNGVVTVNDLVMNNAANTLNPGAGALYVHTKKNIVLSNVSAMNTNSGSTDGIYLNNTASTTKATVTVKNITLNNNTSYGGLNVTSDGAITLTNVIATGNKNYGAYLANNTGDSISSPVTVNTSAFNGSTSGKGLQIYSKGAVKLNQVFASDNSDTGVSVDNTDATTPQAVTGLGFLTANHNGGDGLFILSDGAVTLTNLTASTNGGSGVYIDNETSTLPQAVTITGTNTFSSNANRGLFIHSRGAIVLNNLTAAWNGTASNNSGVYLYNNMDSAKAMAITLNGTNYFEQNGFDGLTAYSFGVITVNNITAVSNGYAVLNGLGAGAYLSNTGSSTPQAINIKGVNVFYGNDGRGLFVSTKGVVTASNLTATGNGNDGAYITNTTGTTAGVTLTGVNTFNSNSGDGLAVHSKGAITINNIIASYNGSNGAYVFNGNGVQSPVTIAGYGLFDWNGVIGLYIESNGAITTKNLTANDNGDDGAYLYTVGITAPQKVTMSGNNTFNSNGNAGNESGLRVYSDGSITLSNVTANRNFYNGVELDNYTNWATRLPSPFATFGSVSVTGFGNFASNGNEGLYISTKGSASITNISASSNLSNDGVGINAYGNVTLTCVSTYNNAYGFYMYHQTPLLTIKGLSSAGNVNTDETLSYTAISRTKCP